ncbi:hypothetical protein BDB00DRAFT_879770 [Zychaea mexicana]|uniref:uncharacterized protein n=1 Tax=Zychaea mexicana TaxID=64656 RepID=UPI0022FF3497|nr:uncharacterized protein BDB00DRAFT_879770 [Zychaea mexicana]KAI9472941.1 hypothetical protein BDB00DRAFT_879770 [Zychaea mexicana]
MFIRYDFIVDIVEVEYITPGTPLFSSSVGDASASSTTAAEAQTEEEPTATAATTDYVGRKRARQAGVPGHTDGSNDNGANTNQSEYQSTGKSGHRYYEMFSATTQGKNQLAAQETACAPVVKEEHIENVCERQSSIESPRASQETHPTAIDTSGTQPSAQRALNEQLSTSASLPLVRKRARENDSGVTEQPITELPPEQSSPKHTKTNEVVASSLMHQEQRQQQQQPQTAASSALSSRHQGGQQQPPQQRRQLCHQDTKENSSNHYHNSKDHQDIKNNSSGKSYKRKRRSGFPKESKVTCFAPTEVAIKAIAMLRKKDSSATSRKDMMPLFAYSPPQ